MNNKNKEKIMEHTDLIKLAEKYPNFELSNVGKNFYLIGRSCEAHWLNEDGAVRLLLIYKRKHCADENPFLNPGFVACSLKQVENYLKR